MGEIARHFPSAAPQTHGIANNETYVRLLEHYLTRRVAGDTFAQANSATATALTISATISWRRLRPMIHDRCRPVHQGRPGITDSQIEAALKEAWANAGCDGRDVYECTIGSVNGTLLSELDRR